MDPHSLQTSHAARTFPFPKQAEVLAQTFLQDLLDNLLGHHQGCLVDSQLCDMDHL